MNTEFRVEQFSKFYDLLMSNAPEEYSPWFFPCDKQGKNPSSDAILKIDKTSNGSWHHESAKLTKEQGIEHIKQGYNIGISARNEDKLIIGDIDEEEYLEQLPTDTLTSTSRKRAGGHFFGWDKDGTAKINLPTGDGELRSCNQYVLAPGSAVPFNTMNEKDKKVLKKLPSWAKTDEHFGYYTVRTELSPKEISFEDLPQFFKDKEQENINKESELQIKDKKPYEKKEGKYSELFELKVSDIVGELSSKKRVGHPLHESDTDSNFSLTEDGALGRCWRHLVSLNAVQFLCVYGGYAKCEDAGTPQKEGGKENRPGLKHSKLKGDKKALEFAYNKAVEMGLIEEYNENKKKSESILTTSCLIDEENKKIIEEVYDKKNGARFCIYNHKDGSIKYDKTYTLGDKKYYPIEGEELEKGAVLLPSAALDYVNNENLDKTITEFAVRWLDAPEETIQFGVWNTKVSYVYENFHTLNYLRVQGDTGTGKTRYLDVWGHLHYKPIFTTGTTTPAPLFRIIDKWRGTVVMDEADLRKSDESEQIIKILNNGFEKGKFIMRCGLDDAKDINFFDPFCPKILSTRRSFTDKATESRCITYISSVTERQDILLNLNEQFFADALKLRNMLLMWRFKNFFEIDKNVSFDLGDIEPRVKQIVGSYISLFSTDEKQMEGFKKYIQKYQEELIVERQSSFDGSIVEAIRKLLDKGIENFDAKDVIEEGQFTDRNGKTMNPRSLTSSLKSLGFKKSEPKKVQGKTKRCIPIYENHLNKLFKRYGFESYKVTVVTVVTGVSLKDNNSNTTPKKEEKEVLEGTNRIHRNDRNSVSSFSEKELEQAGITESEFEELKVEVEKI